MIAIIHKGGESQHVQASVCADLYLGWFNLDDDDSCRLFIYFIFFVVGSIAATGPVTMVSGAPLQCPCSLELKRKKKIAFQWSRVHSTRSNGTWGWCGSFGLVWTSWAKKMKWLLNWRKLKIEVNIKVIIGEHYWLHQPISTSPVLHFIFVSPWVNSSLDVWCYFSNF